MKNEADFYKRFWAAIKKNPPITPGDCCNQDIAEFFEEIINKSLFPPLESQGSDVGTYLQEADSIIAETSDVNELKKSKVINLHAYKRIKDCKMGGK
jgi:hypothetical protein